MEEILNKMLQATELTLSHFMKPDFTPESIITLEELIQSQFPKEGPPSMPTTYIPFGFYLGETVARTIPGATWQLPEGTKNMFDSYIKVPVKDGDGQVFPFVRVSKFFEDRTDTLKAWYDGINLLSLGMLHTPNHEQQKDWTNWKETRPGGMKYRWKAEDQSDQ